MSPTVNDKIERLGAARRRKIQRRAARLIAEASSSSAAAIYRVAEVRLDVLRVTQEEVVEGNVLIDDSSPHFSPATCCERGVW
jgi:hypothetical protein